MKNKIMTILFMLVSSVVQKMTTNREAHKEIALLKLSLFYLKIIKACRLLFISSLGMGICLVFLFSSIALFHLTFFFYAPFSMEIKMWAGFAFSAVYLLIAINAFSYVFTEEKWLSMFHAKDLLKNSDNPPSSILQEPSITQV